ncbi:MAG: LL-diaminopimelate aminotransferase [Chlamydiae bacterium]|nr:LL-diaminopimelate aminotransferase [Chlamydiota bacterium]
MINPHLLQCKRSYLFFEIEQRVSSFRQKHPSANLINLGIGDIALPLAPSIKDAIQNAVLQMSQEEGKKGYGPGCGYRFLREAIVDTEYKKYDIDYKEIFISDGINSDICHASDLFNKDLTVLIADPVYPLYKMTAAIDGFKNVVSFDGITLLPPEEKGELIYLCSPSNPVGVSLSREDLTKWVQYAKKHKAIILYDGAYADFIQDSEKPKSIYEIPGAKEVAIEMRSFSKSAGFTGLRCGYSVVPKELVVDGIEINRLWELRQETKTNGVSYPIQKGAEASLSGQGLMETRAQIKEYQASGAIIRTFLEKQGETFLGGLDCPYIFWKVNKPSWDFFDELLEKANIIAIPGSGFGQGGEQYMRLSTFCTQTQAQEAIQRLCALK